MFIYKGFRAEKGCKTIVFCQNNSSSHFLMASLTEKRKCISPGPITQFDNL
ncbi:MAG: hypothetical protein ACW97V_14945 [Promethearchaeota archaeon]